MSRPPPQLLLLPTVLLLAPLLALARGALAEAIPGVSTHTTGFVGMTIAGEVGVPTLVTSYAELEAVFGGVDTALANPYLAPSVLAFFQNGGRRAYVVRVKSSTDSAFVGVDGGGLEALRQVDDVALLCAPGAASPAVRAAMLRQCEERRDRFAILDTALEATPAEALLDREELEAAGGRGGLYYPWLEPPPLSGFRGPLPPCGFVAGLYARIDVERGVWESPALESLTTPAPHRLLSPSESDLLNSGGVSVIRSIPGRGVLLWGARTTDSDPVLRHVPVRRFLTFLDESIQEGIEWAVFEPNDEPLWARLRACVENFLLPLWRAGALLGTTPSQAFFVRVDRTTMTAADIAAGRTLILAGVALLRPAEFTVLQWTLQRGEPEAHFRRGDANGDGALDVSDATQLLGFLFLGAAAPPCRKAADLNASGVLDLSDAVYALSYLFLGGPPPPAPFASCGAEPLPTELDCASAPCPEP